MTDRQRTEETAGADWKLETWHKHTLKLESVGKK